MSSTATTTTPPFTPTTPTVGGVVQTSSNTFEAWTGGKPNLQRDGLDTTASTTLKHLSQLRPTGYNGQKSQALRTEFSRSEITKNTKITKLKKEMHKDHVDLGLDTIEYLPKDGDMVSVILNSDSFTSEEAEAAYNSEYVKYDGYCQSNDREAADRLLNGLGIDLRKDIDLFYDSTNGFIVVWYALLALLYDSNIDRKRNLESQIRAIEVITYPHQDLKKIIADFLALAEELDDMDSYSHDNSVKILDCLSYAGGGADPGNPDTLFFRNHIITLRTQLAKELIHIRGLSSLAANQHMITHRLHYRHLLMDIQKLYVQQLHNEKWPPANTPLDTRTPALQANAVLAQQGFQQGLHQAFQAYLLQQSNNNNNSRHNRTDNGRNNRNDNGRNNRNDNNRNPKHVAPSAAQGDTPIETKDGIPHYTKQFGNPPETFHWCQTCTRFSRTHWSWQHANRRGGGNTRTNTGTATTPAPPTAGTAANLAEQPTANFDFNTLDFSQLRFYTFSGTSDSDVAPVQDNTFSSSIRLIGWVLLLLSFLHQSVSSFFFSGSTGWLSLGPWSCSVLTDPSLLALHHLGSTFSSIFRQHGLTLNALPFWLWLGLLLLSLIGPHRLVTQRPPPRGVRRHMARLAHRQARPPAPLQYPSFRHPRYQPSRAVLLRQFHEEEVKPTSHHADNTDIPDVVSHLHVNFRLPKERHRCQYRSHRRRRWRSPYSQRLRSYQLRNIASSVRLKQFLRHFKDQAKQNKRTKTKERLTKEIQEWNWQTHYSQMISEQLLQGTMSSTLPHLLSSTSPLASASSWDDDSTYNRSDDDSTTSTTTDDINAIPPTILENDGTVLLYNVTTTIATSIAEFAEDHLFLSATSTDPEPAYPIIWDSGASVCVTPNKDDFVGKLLPPPHNNTKGIGGPIEVTGCGRVAWTFRTENNTFRTLILPAVLVPSATQRLLSTSSLLNQYSAETISITSNGLQLSGSCEDGASTQAIPVSISSVNNLPTAQAYRPMTHIQPPSPPMKVTSDDATVVIDNRRTSPKPPAPIRTLNRNAAMLYSLAEVSKHNINLDEGDKEWLKWHQRLCHRAFNISRYLMGAGVLAKSQRLRALHTRISKRVDIPKCAACCYAKAKRRPAPKPMTTHARVKDAPGSLRDNTLQIGEETSVDHMVSSVPGRTYRGYGKGHKTEMFKGSALFVDNASGHTFVQHQKSLNTHETLRAKEAYEANCRDLGVVPQRYRSDNAAIFHSHEYKKHLESFSQTQKYAGVGQHHANGIVEKAIQDIQSTARTMLIHLAIHWPEQADLSLWPMAIDHAVFIHNHLPNPATGLSPMDKFSRQRWPHSKYHDIHVFGCPTYVLDKKIADGKTLPKFSPRSERYVYLGFSPFHASTVPLVLNPRTGAITPQYHCIFDDWFATLATSVDDVPTFMESHWQTLFGDSEFQFPADDTDPPSLTPTPLSYATAPLDAFEPSTSPYATSPPTLSEPTPSDPVRPSQHSFERKSLPIERKDPPLPPIANTTAPTTTATAPSPIPSEQQTQLRSPTNKSPTTQPKETPMVDLPSSIIHPSTSGPSLRRSSRTTKGKAPPIFDPNPHLKSYANPAPSSNLAEINSSNDPDFNDQDNRHSFPKDTPVVTDEELVLTTSHSSYKRFKTQPESDDGKVCGYYELRASYLGFNHANTPKFVFMDSGAPVQAIEFLKASSSDPDVLSWDDAMASSDREKWLEAALKEIRALEQKGTWLEAPESAATVKVIPGTWVFRLKRAPDGTPIKFKARWVLRGDLQDIDMDTTADVVAWSSVRIFMVLSLKLGWVMKSIDFTNAFLHAKLPEHLSIFAHLPRGFYSNMRSITGERTVLQLKKSQYGTSVAPRLWMDHLMAAFKELGFKSSSYDKCFLIREDMMIVVYVDDCGISTDKPEKVDELVAQLRAKGFDLEIEGNFETFLGVEIRKLDDGRIHLLQEGLIKKVLEAASMTDCNPNYVPASSTPLGKDSDCEDWPQDPWKYSSIVGMLIYLCTNTRPDISYAVSCAARFNSNPKSSHATAVKTILRYLKRTSDKGLIVNFDNTLNLEAYCDADFAGLYKSEDPFDSTVSKSRGGYIIYLGGVPLIWKSSLLSCITLSTLEAEYVQLSRTMTVLLGIKNMLEEFLPILSLPDHESFIRSTIFEDNAGALLLATEQRITNRTRYLSQFFHHFWSSIHRPQDGPPQDNPNGSWSDGKTKAFKISTDKQRADMMTKGLVRVPFERNRLSVNGW